MYRKRIERFSSVRFRHLNHNLNHNLNPNPVGKTKTHGVVMSRLCVEFELVPDTRGFVRESADWDQDYD